MQHRFARWSGCFLIPYNLLSSQYVIQSEAKDLEYIHIAALLDRFFTTRRSVQNNTAEGKTTYYRPSISTGEAHSKTHQKKKTPTSNSEAHLNPDRIPAFSGGA